MHTTRYPLLMFVLINIDAGLNAVKTLRRCRPSGGLAISWFSIRSVP